MSDAPAPIKSVKPPLPTKPNEVALAAVAVPPQPAAPKSRFRSARYKSGAWTNVEDGEPIDRLRADLRDTLNSQNLIVLTGLGTSLCVVEDGKRLAPTMGDLWAAAREKAGARFEKVLTAVKYREAAGAIENIELLLSRCQMAAQLLDNADIKTFISDTEALIEQKVNFLKPDRRLETHEAFLRKLARRPGGRPRLKLFTTNYDMCFEQAAAAASFISVDGFSLLSPHSFDATYFDLDFVRKIPGKDTTEPISNVFHLLKLHGSLNWRQSKDEKRTFRSSGDGKPVIIYPRDSKFETSYKQPFLEMMARFQAALREPNTGFLVCGFGFNDAHLAEPITTALRSNVSLKIIVADPCIEKSQSPAMKWLQDLVQKDDHRITLLEAGFESLVSLIPDLVSKTEAEIHQERLVQAQQ